MSKYIQITLLLTIICSACQEAVDADELINIEDSTYIIGYISPTDTVLTVHVSTAVPAVGTPIPRYNNSYDTETVSTIEKFIIKDATVIISDEENNVIQLNYNPERRNYQVPASEFDIIEGATYFLRVSANNKEYTSSCIIPKKIETITGKIIAGEENEYYQNYNLDVAFQDISGSRNFYLIGGLAEIEYEDGPYIIPMDFGLNSYLTDVIGDGAVVSLNSTFSYFPQDSAATSNAKITLQVTNVEEILYLNRRATYLNNYNDDNPFVEYSIAPNNIEGENGVGVFAGYQLTEKVFEYELK
ncbi:DUF4249 domain-containing protein [Zobellia nedashkovskayae]|uniref:DUF4249 domain-containing protein n=1 Tax=Zobellia nedashkovskayae TaxID=2779510 RepID=UPI00188A4AC4|nr:DUF4249 domain-containing protein [Zobellia nedashkovskayae]